MDEDDHGPPRIVLEIMVRLGCSNGHGERSDGGSRGEPGRREWQIIAQRQTHTGEGRNGDLRLSLILRAGLPVREP
jgi:hypothetical protein